MDETGMPLDPCQPIVAHKGVKKVPYHCSWQQPNNNNNMYMSMWHLLRLTAICDTCDMLDMM